MKERNATVERGFGAEGATMNEGGPAQAISSRPLNGISRPMVGPTQPANLADLLERVLDKGIVIAGDISLSLGTVEVLTLKIRLLIASIDKAQEIGINWWQSDPALSSQAKELEQERDDLKDRVERLEALLEARNGEPNPEAVNTAEANEDDRGKKATRRRGKK
jgi:hypothetical protein